MTPRIPNFRDDSRLRWGGFTIYRHPNSGLRVWIIGSHGTRFFSEASAHAAIDEIVANNFRHVSPGVWHWEAEENTYTTEQAVDHIERMACEMARYERIAE